MCSPIVATHYRVKLYVLTCGCVLQHIPMPVLYGVFLYMGVTSLGGIQVAFQLLTWCSYYELPSKHNTNLRVRCVNSVNWTCTNTAQHHCHWNATMFYELHVPRQDIPFLPLEHDSTYAICTIVYCGYHAIQNAAFNSLVIWLLTPQMDRPGIIVFICGL